MYIPPNPPNSPPLLDDFGGSVAVVAGVVVAGVVVESAVASVVADVAGEAERKIFALAAAEGEVPKRLESAGLPNRPPPPPKIPPAVDDGALKKPAFGDNTAVADAAAAVAVTAGVVADVAAGVPP